MTMTETSYETLQVEREGHLLVVSIHNPPMNVISWQLGLELDGLLDEIAADRDIRAVLFRSAIDGVFIAGADITMLNELHEPDTVGKFKQLAALFDKLAALPQPTVVALGGTTLGGGFEFALACDFRFMATGFGEIGLPEVRLGLLPGGGGTQRLPRLVGAGKATEMLLKGMRYTADQAHDLGLIHGAYAPDELDAKARKYAQSLAAQAPIAVQHIKRLVRASFESPGQAGLELERELFLDVAASRDAKEGIGAFFEGRKPNFEGK